MRIFKALSALLSYPTEDFCAALDEIGAAIDSERLITQAERVALRHLVDNMRGRDLYDLQESYILLFDRTRALSLHLFEHVHGESRDRGQAMVDLRALYESKGLVGADNELPDFTPLFLEFLSTLDPAEALPLLADPAHVFTVLAERLHKRNSLYEAVFRAMARWRRSSPTPPCSQSCAANPIPRPTISTRWTRPMKMRRSISARPSTAIAGMDYARRKIAAGSSPGAGTGPVRRAAHDVHAFPFPSHDGGRSSWLILSITCCSAGILTSA